jgi:hypothetical protein
MLWLSGYSLFRLKAELGEAMLAATMANTAAPYPRLNIIFGCFDKATSERSNL